MSTIGDLLKNTDAQLPSEEFRNVALALLILNIFKELNGFIIKRIHTHIYTHTHTSKRNS